MMAPSVSFGSIIKLSLISDHAATKSERSKGKKNTLLTTLFTHQAVDKQQFTIHYPLTTDGRGIVCHIISFFNPFHS